MLVTINVTLNNKDNLDEHIKTVLVRLVGKAEYTWLLYYHFRIKSNKTYLLGAHVPFLLGSDTNYKSRQERDLIQHKKSVHEGVKYDCDQCDHKATCQAHLIQHQKSVHEGVKYNCFQCDYKANYHTDLIKHKNTVHEGVFVKK